MCNDQNDTTNNCMYEILKTILVLQREANMPQSCLETCDKRCLGCGTPACCCNTRPITIYTNCCCNTKLAMPISKDPDETVTSTVFRIEKLDENCATFRVLVANNRDDSISYTSTDSFFTINLNCICVLKCLSDTFIECL